MTGSNDGESTTVKIHKCKQNPKAFLVRLVVSGLELEIGQDKVQVSLNVEVRCKLKQWTWSWKWWMCGARHAFVLRKISGADVWWGRLSRIPFKVLLYDDLGGHRQFWSSDKDGGHSIRSVISENAQLYANFTAVSYEGRPINKLQNGIILLIFKI